MSAARRWLGRSGLVLAGLCAGLVLAEGAARVLSPTPAAELLGEPTRDATPGLYWSDPVLGYVPVPGYDVAWPGPQGDVRVRIAPEGYRLPAPVPGQPRWIAVGDSYTMGVQVPEDRTFAARLGQRLGWSVINGGVDGYGTWQAGLRYEQLDDALQAEGVIYVLFEGNDLTDNGIFLGRMRASLDAQGRPVLPVPAHGFTPERIVPFRAPGLWDRLRGRSVLLAALHVLLHRPELARSGTLERFREETRCMTVPGQGERRALLDQLGQALAFLRQSAAARGDRLLVAVAPAPWMMDPQRAEATLVALGQPPGSADVAGFHADVLQAVQAAGLMRCDLLPALQAAEAQGAQPFLRYDGHWSVAGHQVVAEALAACLSPEG